MLEPQVRLRKMLKNSIYIIVFSLFISCEFADNFTMKKRMPTSRWHRDSIACFKTTFSDSVMPYNMYININNIEDYNYSNLFVIAEMVFPNGKTYRDTLEYEMTTPNGNFLGTGRNVKRNKLWYKEQFVFEELGEYTFKVEHAMRKNGQINGLVSLEGITEVGFEIEKIED